MYVTFWLLFVFVYLKTLVNESHKYITEDPDWTSLKDRGSQISPRKGRGLNHEGKWEGQWTTPPVNIWLRQSTGVSFYTSHLWYTDFSSCLFSLLTRQDLVLLVQPSDRSNQLSRMSLHSAILGKRLFSDPSYVWSSTVMTGSLITYRDDWVSHHLHRQRTLEGV
jgi:hypothetical protein